MWQRLNSFISKFRILYADPEKVKIYLNKVEREGIERVKVVYLSKYTKKNNTSLLWRFLRILLIAIDFNSKSHYFLSATTNFLFIVLVKFMHFLNFINVDIFFPDKPLKFSLLWALGSCKFPHNKFGPTGIAVLTFKVSNSEGIAFFCEIRNLFPILKVPTIDNRDQAFMIKDTLSISCKLCLS